MKRIVCILAAAALLSATALSACDKTTKTDNTPSDAPQATQPATEPATVSVTEPPTEPVTEPPTEPPVEETDPPQSENPEKAELVNNKWSLRTVYDSDGQEISPQFQYGSVIRQSGAYIEFHEDNTFKCILGTIGCEGTYELQNGVVLLHLTVKYTGKGTESCDEDSHLVWDHDETIKFDFNNVTNVFKKV